MYLCSIECHWGYANGATQNSLVCVVLSTSKRKWRPRKRQLGVPRYARVTEGLGEPVIIGNRRGKNVNQLARTFAMFSELVKSRLLTFQLKSSALFVPIWNWKPGQMNKCENTKQTQSAIKPHSTWNRKIDFGLVLFTLPLLLALALALSFVVDIFQIVVC